MDTTQPQLDNSTAKSATNLWSGIGLLVLAVIAVYYPMIRGQYTWDDDWHVIGNPYLNNWSGVLEMFNPTKGGSLFFPITLTFFWLERSLFGVQNPLPFHVVSIMLHAANTIVLWRLLQRLKIRWAAMAAAIFAIHPMHVETVAWISEQKTLLACQFTFLAVWAYVEFLDLRDAADPWRRWLFYGLAALLFLLALLSKAVVCTLPLGLLLIVYWRQGCIQWRDVAFTLPFLVMGLVIACIFAMPNFDHPVHTEDIDFSLHKKLVIAGWAIWFYIGKILWPAPVVPIYPLWHLSTAWWEFLPLALAVAMLVLLWKLRRHIGRGPFVAMALLILTLSPALSFVSFSYFRVSFVADHFAYPADVALIVLFVGIIRVLGIWLLYALKQSSLIAKYWTEMVWIGVIAIVMGPLTWGQASLWGDQVTLWQYTVKNNPESWQAHTCLAVAYGKIGDIENARNEATISLGKRKTADAFRIRATAWMYEGKLKEAAADFREDMEADPNVPDSCIRLGEVEEQLGDIPQALEAYREAVRRQPRLFRVWSNIAQCEYKLKHWTESIAAAKHSIELDSTYPMGHFNLARAFRVTGDLPGAISEYRLGLELDPGLSFARLQLARALAESGQLPAAVGEYRRVTQERPGLAEAHAQLADVLAKLGDNAGAEVERAAAQTSAQPRGNGQ